MIGEQVLKPLAPVVISFKSATISVALTWANHFTRNLGGANLLKAWFKRVDSSFKEVPQYMPYKEGYNNTYSTFLNRVLDDDDRRMFSYLCRVLLYRYSLHKGYVKNDGFDLSKYIANGSHELYQLGVLKLGREELAETPKPQAVPVTAEINNCPTKLWKEIDMNQIESLSGVAKTEATLIHGRLLSELSESDLIQMIRKARKSQEDIKDLVETSTRMKARFDQLEADIKVYAEALDALPVK
jgi:hypothetical protein